MAVGVIRIRQTYRRRLRCRKLRNAHRSRPAYRNISRRKQIRHIIIIIQNLVIDFSLPVKRPHRVKMHNPRQMNYLPVRSETVEPVQKIPDDVIYIPKTSEMLTPILSVMPLHLFAYHMGVLRGNDVDKPRNLAKSVTVE